MIPGGQRSANLVLVNFFYFFIIAVFAAIILLRCYLAYSSSFWCDELGWILPNSGSVSNMVKFVLTEPGPLGFLEPVTVHFISKLFLFLGFHPHLALRVEPIFISLMTSFLPFFLDSATKKEKVLWLLWSLFSVPISWASLNFRPNGGLIFFAACLMFASLNFFRSNQSLSKKSWALYLIGLTGVLYHPYVFFPLVASLFTILFSRPCNTMKRKIIAMHFITIIVMCVWYFYLRSPVGYGEWSWTDFFAHLRNASWVQVAAETVRSLISLGVSFKIALPFYIIGFLFLWRESRQFVIYVLLSTMLSILGPFVLSLKYKYFFVPRQALAALPCIGWALVYCMNELWAMRKQFALLILPILLAAIFVVLVPFVKWALRIPPYFDVPHYRIEQALNASPLKLARRIIVLSSCHVGSVNLYFNKLEFENFFEKYKRNQVAQIMRSDHILQWTIDDISCSGVIPELTDNNEIKLLLKANSKDIALIAPEGVKVPKSVRLLPCRTETNKMCL